MLNVSKDIAFTPVAASLASFQIQDSAQFKSITQLKAGQDFGVLVLPPLPGSVPASLWILYSAKDDAPFQLYYLHNHY
jgi:hypothetical protein